MGFIESGTLPNTPKGTTMLVLKGCPRCHGDLLLTTYMDDRSTNCLQCGFSRALPAATRPEARILQFDDDRRNAARRVRLALREGA